MKIHFIWLDLGATLRSSTHHGLASMAGHLGNVGHDVTLSHIRSEDDVARLADNIGDFSPDIIGISLVTNQQRYLDNTVRKLRSRYRGVIVCGGVHPTLAPEDTLMCEGVDGVVLGEGEYPLADLAKKMERGEPPHSEPSVRWRENGASVSGSGGCAPPFERDIANYSIPDYSIFDIESKMEEISGYMAVMISRGCPYQCAYCVNHAIKNCYPSGRGYFRILDPDIAVERLVALKERFGVEGFIFEDDLLLWNHKWFSDFSEAYAKNVGIPYTCTSRFNLITNREVVTQLKESGCKRVRLGLECGDEEYRKNVLKRGYSNDQVFKTAELLHESKMPFYTYNMVGLPFETKEQMEQTLALNQAIRPTSGHVFFFFPYPGTELYDLCKQNGLLEPENIEELSDNMEKPAIKLPNCTDEDCVKIYQKLSIYLLVRRLTKMAKIDWAPLDSALSGTLMIAPDYVLNMTRKENLFKAIVRKFLYRRF